MKPRQRFLQRGGEEKDSGVRLTNRSPVVRSPQSGSRCPTWWQRGWRWPCGRSWLCLLGAGNPPWWSRTPSSLPWSSGPPVGDAHSRLWSHCMTLWMWVDTMRFNPSGREGWCRTGGRWMSHYLVQSLPLLLVVGQVTQTRRQIPETHISVLRLIRENGEQHF